MHDNKWSMLNLYGNLLVHTLDMEHFPWIESYNLNKPGLGGAGHSKQIMVFLTHTTKVEDPTKFVPLFVVVVGQDSIFLVMLPP